MVTINSRKSSNSTELFQTLSIGWLEVDGEGKILAMNPVAGKMLSISDGFHGNVIFWDYFDDHITRARFTATALKSQPVSDLETLLTRPDGTRIWVKLNIRASSPDDCFECALQDITVKKQLDLEYQNLKTTVNKQRRLADSLGRMILSTSLFQELNPLLKLICTEATNSLGLRSAQIWALQGESLVGLAAHGNGQDEIRGHYIPISDAAHVGVRVIRNKIPLHFSNLGENNTNLYDGLGRSFPARSILATPLITSGRVIGVMILFDEIQNKVFDGDDLEFSLQLGNQIANVIENVRMVDGLKTANRNIADAYDATLAGWARALELRDLETEGHTQRVVKWTLDLTRSFHLDDDTLTQIYRGALLHDIGKMGIPDSILLKPGPLDSDELIIMRRHPVYAYEMLKSINYLKPALDIPYSHHEKWDGSGYPQGLSREEIPLSARIFCVVDVWDALTSKRPYRDALPPERALEYITSESGKHFDPLVVERFLSIVSGLQ